MDTESTSSSYKLGPWPLGIINVRPDYIPDGGLVDATNVYIDKYGIINYTYTPTHNIAIFDKNTWRGWRISYNDTKLYFNESVTYPDTADDPYDKSDLFIMLHAPIEWVAPLPTGMYIYAGSAVYWLDGPELDSLRLARVAGSACKGRDAVAIISAESLNPEHTNGSSICAIWMTSVGFALGLPSGNVVYPQADRLVDLPLMEGRIEVFQDRVFFYVS